MPNILLILARRKFMKIAFTLYERGAEFMNKEYPSVSVEELTIANDYFASLRCAGCSCWSCVDLPGLGSKLDEAPAELVPIAQLCLALAKEELNTVA